jgi:hypothetical protein
VRVIELSSALAGVLIILGVNEGASTSAVTMAMEVATKRSSHRISSHDQHQDYGQQDQQPYLKHPMTFSIKERDSLLHRFVITQVKYQSAGTRRIPQ